jgi:hypothetical protein
MRIWSIHPEYLDARGLVALWRETLLAKHVLEGKTKGYRHHPQLERFKKVSEPVEAIDQYLVSVFETAIKRGYSFDETKINRKFKPVTIPVTEGQIRYEFEHLLRKLERRDPRKFNEVSHVAKPKAHPMFRIVKGDIERWEVVAASGK